MRQIAYEFEQWSRAVALSENRILYKLGWLRDRAVVAVMPRIYFIGVDVGTSSARAALVTSQGEVIKQHSEVITIWNPEKDHYEQSSDNIWNSICECVQVSWFPILFWLLIFVSRKNTFERLRGGLKTKNSTVLLLVLN